MEHPVVRRELEGVAGGEDVVGQGAMGDGDAFGPARGAGGVDDVGGVGRVERDSGRRVGIVFGIQFFEEEDFAI